jgi:hypothetical protein
MAATQVGCCEICRRIFNWILQLGLIAAIIFVLATMNKPAFEGWYVALPIIFYIAYIINALCSPTFSYLLHKHKANTIHDYMKTLFATAPIIRFHVECYHYETRYETYKDANGNTQTRSSQVKITTYTGHENFYYYSWRDISGVFLLDVAKFLNKNFQKAYIKLKLNLDINYADDGTFSDYTMQKFIFHARNRWRDVHMHTWETTDLPGMNKYNMVRVSDNKAPFVNACLYILFTLFPFIELYKIYVNLYCENQTYTLKKVVSSRTNLNVQANVVKYEIHFPKIIIYGSEVVYNQETILVQTSPYIPSQEDLNIYQKEGGQPQSTPMIQTSFEPVNTGYNPGATSMINVSYESVANNGSSAMITTSFEPVASAMITTSYEPVSNAPQGSAMITTSYEPVSNGPQASAMITTSFEPVSNNYNPMDVGNNHDANTRFI